jgi:aspartokinase/homoserine dehydrogenase 1
LRSKINSEICNSTRPPRSSEHSPAIRASHNLRGNVNKPLRIMKFGGTSVGDAACIRNVVEIIRAASRESDIVVVVSAMAGVTNKLIVAATQSESGNRDAVTTLFKQLGEQHNSAASALLESPLDLHGKMNELLQEGDSLCQETVALCQLTPCASDSISSLGERLSAPLVAAVLSERGLASKAIDATELITTDSRHGAADPLFDRTRQNCQMRLRPLLQQGIVPVVTGFIGATAEGVRTTLGRGGSDYSATILGAALDADEVIIWTDVEGLMTADPRVVSDARTISEISYREAAELAYFGAKVLHPKTLRPVLQSRIPLQIRNTFAPEQAGTKITPAGPSNVRMKAVASISDVALITVRGRDLVNVTNALGQALSSPSSPEAEVMLISPSPSGKDTCLVVRSSVATALAEALLREFGDGTAHQHAEQIKIDSTVAVVTVVGQHVCTSSDMIARVFSALARENVNVLPMAQTSSECNFSYVVARKDLKAALVTTHREFQLGEIAHQSMEVACAIDGQATWLYE